jgi:hypothetical protein
VIVTYTLSAEDTHEASIWRNVRVLLKVNRLKPGERLNRVLGRLTLWSLSLCMPLVFLGSVYPAFAGFAPFRILLVLSGLITLLVVYVFIKTRTLKGEEERFEKDPQLAGPFSTELTETGLNHIAPRWSTTIDWRAISVIAETKLLLLITETTPRSIILPKRAFATAKDREQFIAALMKGVAGAER